MALKNSFIIFESRLFIIFFFIEFIFAVFKVLIFFSNSIISIKFGNKKDFFRVRRFSSLLSFLVFIVAYKVFKSVENNFAFVFARDFSLVIQRVIVKAFSLIFGLSF
jgi:hypothetical protein